MSVCSQLRATGLAVLLDVDGDPVSFRGSTVSALVTRALSELRSGPGMQEVALNLLGGSSIEVLRSALSSAPRLGEIFTEPDGTTHRIEKVNATPTTWKLDCAPTDP